jgi:hypothetical protein
MRLPRRRTAAALAFATAVLSIAAPAAQSHAASTSSSRTSPASSHHKSTAVSKSKTVKRVYIDNGKTTVQDKRKVHVTVSDTKDLRSLEQVKVKWSGAHQTDGIYTDTNSDFAQNEEYSFDLFECRGTDAASAPKKDRLSPDNCWTQFADERFRDSYDAYPAWRSDAYASTADRQAIVDGEPTDQQPPSCANQLIGVEAQRWVPYIGADGTDYPGGPDGCAGQAPEASPDDLSSLTLPSNETFGVTDAHGNGQSDFDIFTSEDHASLGCSSTVPCSLVAIPIEGISCDDAGSKLPASQQPTGDDLADATSNCETTGNFAPGQLLNNVEESGAAAVDGTLWWSPSNWRNRITFPLHFAPADDVCSIVSKERPLDIYGSELMTQATTQWAPHFCLDSKLFNLKHVQTPEPEARNLLAAGNIKAALTSDPPTTPYTTPTVQAPVSVTGFGIAFDIDNDNQKQVVHLNLDARLLAKLLTESYPAETFVKDGYPPTHSGVATLSNNPLNLGDDPEFQALNPGIPAPEIDSAATLLTLDSQSDVTYALTSYINADPQARAWLNGKPDPWGMRVNPNYQGIKLPVDNWPLLDTYEPLDEYQPGKNDCLAADPVPYLPLVAAPTAALFSIANDMEFAISQSQTTCYLPSPIPGSTAGAKLVANGRESPGHQFMLGVVSLGDARRYNLPVASLESQRSSSTPAMFTSTKGQTFVAPSDDSMKAAADLLKPDNKAGTWPISYNKWRTASAAKDAYPGTLVVYADIPTSGLHPDDARAYADLLDYTSGAGQVPGIAQGQLAPGFLPVTASNGLAAMMLYTKRAAVAVDQQAGKTPSLKQIKKQTKPPKTPPPSSTKPSGTPPSSGTTPLPGVSSPPATNPGPKPDTAPTPTPTSSTVAVGKTEAIDAGIGRELFPLVVLLLLIAGGTAAGLKLFRRPRR